MFYCARSPSPSVLTAAHRLRILWASSLGSASRLRQGENVSGHTVFSSGFFADPGFDFETRVVLGQVTYGGADCGEVLSTLERIQDGDADSWVLAWSGLGERLAGLAEASEARGHRVSAADTWLRAAVAYAATLNVLAEGGTLEGLLPLFRRHRHAWSRFCTLQAPPWEPVAIPYEGRSLPGWFAPCDGSGKAGPTLILNNGSDGPISSMLAFGGAGARARGYNLLFFDGPGQQSQLFEQGSFFRHDWEAVITPVVDFLRGRADVDSDAIALYGVSQGGYWVPRAIAFEHRLAAAIADTGVVDVSASWLRHLPLEMAGLLERGDKAGFNAAVLSQGGDQDPKLVAMWNFRSRPYGTSDPYEVFAKMLKYRIEPADAARIRTPLLVTDPEGEQFWPGQAERLAAMTAGVSTLLRFSAAQGANLHCEPMARRLVDQQMLDWLDEKLGRPASGAR